MEDEEISRDLDLEEYLDGTDDMLGTIHAHGPFDVGDGMRRLEVKNTTDLSKSQVRTRAEDLIEDGFLVEQRVDIGQANPEVRYRLTDDAREVAAACAESFRIHGEVPQDPGRKEYLEMLTHVSRLRREEDIGEEDRSLDDLVTRVSRLEDRLDTIEDDQEVLHNKKDTLHKSFNDLINTVSNETDSSVGRCKMCAQIDVLEKSYPEGLMVCSDCV